MMYPIEVGENIMRNVDLYDKQSIIGAKIERLLNERAITKAEVCNKTGISKPTLDKLLKGKLTNRVNYGKHINKLFEFLNISDVDLLGHKGTANNQIRLLRNILERTQLEVSQMIDMPIERYVEIEEGATATLAELRDISVVLLSSVNDLLGENYFITQLAQPYLLMDENCSQYVSGFWGHIGILLTNTKEYRWYPISFKVKRYVCSVMNQEWFVIPCMNNKLLVVNTNYVKEIILSDFDSDQPDFVNWDYKVDCGEVPLVFYEAMGDYYGEYTKNDMSNRFIEVIESIANEKGLDREQGLFLKGVSEIIYSDGNLRQAVIDLTYDDNLVSTIRNIYENGDCSYVPRFIPYSDLSESDMLLNIQNVSMLELPLVEVEETIRNMFRLDEEMSTN